MTNWQKNLLTILAEVTIKEITKRLTNTQQNSNDNNVATATTISNQPMTLSNNGINLIKGFEGFVAQPYQDAVGVWTIGYGNTYYADGRRVSANDRPLTEVEATQLKQAIINRDFVPAINRLLANEIQAGKVNQNMFDALVSLAYNIGVGALSNSSVIRHLKAGDKQLAGDSFLLWNKASGRELAGLTYRRQAERQLFLS